MSGQQNQAVTDDAMAADSFPCVKSAQRFVSDGQNSNARSAIKRFWECSRYAWMEHIVVVCISWHAAIRNKNVILRTSLLLGNVLAWTKCVNIKVFPFPCSRLRFYVSVTLLPSKPTEDKTCKLWRALRLFVDRPGFILLNGIYWQ